MGERPIKGGNAVWEGGSGRVLGYSDENGVGIGNWLTLGI